MDYLALKALIDSDPDGKGYVGMPDFQVAGDLNEKRHTKPVSFMANLRTMLSAMNPVDAVTIMSKLEAAASSDPVLARVVPMLSPEAGGIDVGHPNARAMLDQLATAGVLTMAEVATLKAMGEETCSLAELSGFGHIRAGDVQQARIY